MRACKYIILDVDGTLTDGSIYYDDMGHEMKKFNIKDGLAIVQAKRCGVQFVIITGRMSTVVERRMEELGVDYIFQGIKQKDSFLKDFFQEKNINPIEAAYIGDDLNDFSAMSLCGFKACPEDACEEIKQIADYISEFKAGYGAVRNIIEHILKEQKLWNEVVAYFKNTETKEY